MALAASAAAPSPASAQDCPLGILCPPGQPAPPGPPPEPLPKPVGVSEGEFGDPGNSGFIDDPAVAPPFRIRWVASTPGPIVRAPLVASGKVVFLLGPGSGGERDLVALDPTSGRRIWTSKVGPAEQVVHAAGRFFVATTAGEVVAIDAGTGARVWEREVYNIDRAPLIAAEGGTLYAVRPLGGAPDPIRALAAADGSVIWQAEGPGGIPGLDSQHVYLVDQCENVLALRRGSGAAVWRRGGSCAEGLAGVATLSAGRLLLADVGALDPATGRVLWSADSDPNEGADVLANGDVVVRAELGAWTGNRLATGARLWDTAITGSAELPDPRDRHEVRPIVVGDLAFGMAGDGTVSAVELEGGRTIWRGGIAAQGLPHTGVDAPAPRIGAGAGALLVPVGRNLVAFESELRPLAAGIDAGLSADEVLTGRTTDVLGLVGEELRGGRPEVSLLADPWPYGRFRRFATARATPRGFFHGRRRVARNTRFYAAVPGARTRRVTAYAYPRIRVGAVTGNRRRPVIGLRVRGPRSVSFARRSVVLYAGRAQSRRLTRIGTARLRRTGAGAAAARVRIRRLSSGGTVRVVACVTRIYRLGLGSPSDPLVARCGRPRITLRRIR